MSIFETSCKFQGGMKFEAQFRAHKVPMDATAAAGGSDLGPTPKELLLAGMCGCAGMDIVSLLKKMRVEYQEFAMTAGTDLTIDHPRVFKDVYLNFQFRGDDTLKASTDKVIKSVTMAMSKYCGVSAMIAKTAPIAVRVLLNGEEVYNDVSHFEIG